MNLSINSSLFSIDESIKLGINHYTKFVVSDSPQMLKGRMQLFQEYLYFDLLDKKLTEFEGIREWRELIKKFETDSNLFTPSMEALMRRIQVQDYIKPENSAVDLNNFFSLQYEIPVGLYDVSHINGDVELCLGDKLTTANNIIGNQHTLKGILTLCDRLGPFGNPFVNSPRTIAKEDTTEALHVFYLKPSMKYEEAKKLLISTGKMFVQVNGGEYTSQIVDKQHLQVSFD